MKAKRIKPGQIVNPLFSHADRREAKRSGTPYLTEEFLDQPVGQVVEDVDCWRQCVLGNMVPADEECQAAVKKFMNSESRKKLLNQIRQLRAAHGVKQLPEPDRKWLEYMEETYAEELAIG